jgi:hypothetical protein
MAICLDEVRRCQRASPKPNFIEEASLDAVPPCPQEACGKPLKVNPFKVPA